MKNILIIVVLLIVGGFTSSSEGQRDTETTTNSTKKMFAKSAVIFGAITIQGTSGVPDEKLKHAAQVTAQWLDNDQDGTIDDVNLQQALIESKPIIIMSKDGFSFFQMMEIVAKYGGHKLQDLSAEETNNPSRRDASQEEIHHIIMNAGFQVMAPDIFSEKSKDDSKLFNIWKFADENGHYFYDDPTCNDGCKTTEFVYLATAAYLDSQADLFSDEMRVKTKEALKEKLPGILEIFESKDYVYPTHMWPNGDYNFTKNIKYSGI